MKRKGLLPFLLGNAAVGAGVALGLVGLMLAADVAQLRTLVAANEAGPLALAVMTAFFMITFASVQMGMAVMLRGDEGGPRARSFRFVPEPRPMLRPVPIPVRTRRR